MKSFNPKKANSYSTDELFEYAMAGSVSLEGLEGIGLNEERLVDLKNRIVRFNAIKEEDDWNSVKDLGPYEIYLFKEKYSHSGHFYYEATNRLQYFEELDKVIRRLEYCTKELRNRYLSDNLKSIEYELTELLSYAISYNRTEENEIECILTKLRLLVKTLDELNLLFTSEDRSSNSFFDICRSGYRFFDICRHDNGYLYRCRPDNRDIYLCCPDDRYFDIRCSHLEDEEPLSYTPKRLFDFSILDFFKKKKQLCNSAIFAPYSVAKGDDILVQVYIYKDDETEKVVIDASITDNDAEKRSYTPLNFPIKDGDKISVTLDMHGLIVEGHSTKSIIWRNKFTKCSFFVHIPLNYEKNKVLGDVYLHVNELEIGQMSFFSVIGETTRKSYAAEVEAKIYEKVFISYSHKDDRTVNAIAEAYKALGTIKYFYDRHSLEPGDMFEEKIYEFIDQSDIFILCWSKNAEQSEWVTKERVRAFRAARNDPPQLRMYPINISPYAPPPPDLLGVVHFNDYDKLINPESELENNNDK